MKTSLGAWWLSLVLLALPMQVWSAASLRTETELLAELGKAPPCCVIDARSAASVAIQPLAHALKFRKNLQITPTAAVVVVADDNRAALSVASEIAASYPDKPIYAVKGGLATWLLVRKALDESAAARAGAAPAGVGFVIPQNTCESGSTLQELTSGTPK